MRHIKQAVVVLAALLVCGTSWGETEKKFSVEFIKKINRNRTVLTVQKDADMFLYTLNKLNENKEGNIRGFMEYILDAIVCESWQNTDNLDSSQLERTMKVLYAIKEYREQNPRSEKGQVRLEEVSSLFAEYDETYVERARSILAELQPQPGL